MLGTLERAVEELRIPPDGESIAAALALRDRLDARIAEAVATFDAGRLWDLDAATSITAWLRTHGAMTARAAKRLASLARRLRSLPVTAAAFADGRLSAGQVEAITAVVDDDAVELFAQNETDLVPALASLPVSDCGRAMAAWRARAEAALGDGADSGEPERSVHLSATMDGRWVLDGSLDAEGGAVVATALRLATAEPAPDRSPATRRADALVDLCRHFLDHQQTHRGGRHRPHLNVVVDLDALEARKGGAVVGGPAVDAATVSRLLCDSALHRVVTAGPSAVLDYGTATRTIPAPLWNALVLRDHHCRFPGCDRPSNWCEGHHVVWITEGGPTNLANLVLACARHHHRLHQPGWHAKLRPDASLVVTDPAGRVRASAPVGAGPAP